MQTLTPQQAQALWHAGGFIVLPGLPEGSEYGLDGTYHIIRSSFTGSKFVPPGLHLITWSPPSSSSGDSAGPGPGTIPIRSGLLVYLAPRERLVLAYDPSTESISVPSRGDKVIVGDDHLRALDPGLAAYPFDGLDGWKALTTHVTTEIAQRVLGEQGRVDGMRAIDGDEGAPAAVAAPGGNCDASDLATGSTLSAEDVYRPMCFVRFDQRRSWRAGAVGEEVTRFARDKSWLLFHVIEQLGGDPASLLGQLQLAFILLLHLSSFPALGAYKRLFSILCRASSVHTSPNECSSDFRGQRHQLRDLYVSMISAVHAHLISLPEGVFETELPELDVWYIDELEQLRGNIRRSFGVAGCIWEEGEPMNGVQAAWEVLEMTARRRYGWELSGLEKDAQGLVGAEVEDEDDEEGEYAPVIVET